MLAMNIKKIAKAINNDLRIEIMEILSTRGELTVKEIHSSLSDNKPKYRQSVNKSLEILKEADLIKKSYNDKKKNIVYEIKSNRLVIDFDKMKVIHTD